MDRLGDKHALCSSSSISKILDHAAWFVWLQENSSETSSKLRGSFSFVGEKYYIDLETDEKLQSQITPGIEKSEEASASPPCTDEVKVEAPKVAFAPQIHGSSPPEKTTIVSKWMHVYSLQRTHGHVRDDCLAENKI